MRYGNLTWHIPNFDAKRAIGDRFRRKIFLGFVNGRPHYSIGKGSKYWDKHAPKGEDWDYE